MARIETQVESCAAIDWTGCELIEQIPGKVSGRPIVRETRILPDAIVNRYELGDSVEEIHEGFPALSILQIERLIEFGLSNLRQFAANYRTTPISSRGQYTKAALP